MFVVMIFVGTHIKEQVNRFSKILYESFSNDLVLLTYTSLLHYTNHTVTRGFSRYLSNVRVNFRVVRKSILDCLTNILNIPLLFPDLNGFIKTFVCSFNSLNMMTKVLNNISFVLSHHNRIFIWL